MKSLRYMLRGKPHNLDDCLDYSNKENPLEVSVELATAERVGEMYIIKQMLSIFTWNFPAIKVKYEEIYGAFFYDQGEKKQKKEIDKSNIRLEAKLDKLKELGINITGKEKRFDYSAIPSHSKS